LFERGRSLQHSLLQLRVEFVNLLQLLASLRHIADYEHATQKISVRIDDRSR
jgi:hypothetical protein